MPAEPLICVACRMPILPGWLYTTTPSGLQHASCPTPAPPTSHGRIVLARREASGLVPIDLAEAA